MQPPRACIAPVANELPGHQVVLADGEEIGVVKAVTTEPPGENVDIPDEPMLVIEVELEAPELQARELLVPESAVLTVTEHDVILGTTARWIEHHAIPVPSNDELHA